MLASSSEGKVREIRDILEPLGVELLTLDDVGWQGDIPETRDSFEGNAAQKAEHVCAALGLPVLADDSGLEVDALGGAPGVRSSRFAGPGKDDATRNRELLRLLWATGTAPPWPARYRCVVALAAPGQTTQLFEGTCEGAITDQPRGDGGFGYDPVFLLPDRGVTVGEISLSEKQAISHRGHALRQLVRWLSGADSRG